MTVHNDGLNQDKPPLVTALILHYENGDTIFETIDSVLRQTYPNIELIISDDCSKKFDSDRIMTYVENNKGSNIVSCVVRTNENNQGTVRHCETIRLQTKGEIEFSIDSGDIWADRDVFSSFVDRFNELGPDAEFITSQIDLCDENLDSLSENFISPFVLQMLKTSDMNSLKDAMVKSCVLPSSGSAFRKSFFERIGTLSTDYRVMKDWGAYLRWLRMGKKVYLLDKTTVKHRGKAKFSIADFSPAEEAYRHDMVEVFVKEIEPYKSCFSDYGYQTAKNSFDTNKKALLSLRSRTTILLCACNSWPKAKESLDSILRCLCMNTEIVVECHEQLTESVIFHLSKKYLFCPEIQRVRVIEYRDEPAQINRLTQAASGDRILLLSEGECVDSSLFDWVLSDWIWSTKASSAKVFQSYAAIKKAQSNTANIELATEGDVDTKAEPPITLRRRCSKLLRKHRKTIKRWSNTHAIIESFVLLIVLHCAFVFATLFPNLSSFESILEAVLVACIVVQWFVFISRCILKLVLAARA